MRVAFVSALAVASLAGCTGPKPPPHVAIRGWLEVSLSPAQCRRVARAIVAPPMRAAVVVSSDRRVLARTWADPLVLNAAAWPSECQLLGPFAATVPGRDSYTARAGSGRSVEVSWPTLSAAGNELDVSVPFDRAGAAAVPGARTVPSPSPAPPIP